MTSTEPVVLIVDDNANNLKVLEGILATAGYQVRPALSGEAALRAVKSMRPDLILLDIRMPDLDGYEVCRRLKQLSATRDVPIIFISALRDLEDKVEAFRAGGQDYISKPFQTDEVLARVRTHVELSRSRQLLTRANEHLEDMVATRTQALAEANGQLADANNQLAQAMRQEQALRHLLALSHSPLSTVEFLKQSLQWLSELFDWQTPQRKSALFLTREQGAGSRMDLVASQGYTLDQQTRCAQIDYQDCQCGEAALRQQAIRVEAGLCPADRIEPEPTPAYRLALPLISAERTLGVLVHAIQGNTALGTDEESFLRQVADVLSMSIARRYAEERVIYMAHFDALTSLPNRVLLADRLHQAMAQAQRRGQLLAVAYLDLDGFKNINDHYGHDVGDQLLTVLATRTLQALRVGDTLARLGGDEFVAVLLDLSNIDESVPMLARLLEASSEPVQVGELVLQMTASIGVTFFPQAEEVDADQLLRQADQAMYQAKLAGKNRYHIFDPAQDRSVRGHNESLELIRRALVAEEFVLHYQPKVNMRTGVVIGAEALIRWQHPERGLLPPAAFLPVIEDHALAVVVGEWVIDSALRQIELWQQAGLNLPVSVNVGSRQLQQVDFVERLRELLSAHPQVTPGQLELEVLETSALEDLVHVSKVIEACRQIGVSFALDDFGTGYSSLTYLKRLSVAMLKIDQSFVRGMLDDPDDLAILEGVLGLSTAFRRQTIAEGVETIEHGEMLLQLGCELAQGYGIARPMPAHELPTWLVAWRPDPRWLDRKPVSRDNLALLSASIEHRAWILAIDSALKGEREAPPPLDPHHCRFGAWLDTEILAGRADHATFQRIDVLHQQVHALAAKLCELREQGRNPQGLARLDELHALRDELLRQLKNCIPKH